MQEMLHPTAFMKGTGMGKFCGLVTDGRFSGGSSGLVISHVSPEAAGRGTIGLVEDGDEILIDVKTRTLKVLVDDEVLADRRAKMEASERPWQPKTASALSPRRCGPTRNWRRRPTRAQSASSTKNGGAVGFAGVFAASVVFLFGVLPFFGESLFAVGGVFGRRRRCLSFVRIPRPMPTVAISVIEWLRRRSSCIEIGRGLVPGDGSRLGNRSVLVSAGPGNRIPSGDTTSETRRPLLSQYWSSTQPWAKVLKLWCIRHFVPSSSGLVCPPSPGLSWSYSCTWSMSRISRPVDHTRGWCNSRRGPG